METIEHILAGCLVTPGEAISYAVIVSILSVLHLSESCLINTFTFSFYWGFKSLLGFFSLSDGVAVTGTILVYVISGLAIFGLVNLYYLRERRLLKQPANDGNRMA